MSLFDPRERELCEDGACIGLIGPDGHCKECGRPGASAKLDPRRRGLRDDDEVGEELEAHIIKGDTLAAPESFAERELCPDGTCIGVIGKDGRCKECGTPAVRDARSRDESSAEEAEQAQQETDEAARDRGEEDEGSGGFEARELCSDGACIGLIGKDGRCKECGLPAAGQVGDDQAPNSA